MAKLALQLLGEFALRRPTGARVPIPTGKVRALLAYLAEQPGKAYRRDHLASLLWRDRPDAAARHSLSQALTTLRNAAGRIVTQPEGEPALLALDDTRVEVDIATFRSHAAQASESALRRAAELYDEPLAGLDVAEPEFEDWLATTRADLLDLAIRVYEALLSIALDRPDQTEAMSIAKQLLQIDPASEVGHRALITVHLTQGQPRRALEQYQICRGRLRDEYGIPPDPQTEELVCRIRNPGLFSVPGVDQPDRRMPSILVVSVADRSPSAEAILRTMTSDITVELERFWTLWAVGCDTVIGSRDLPGAAAQLSADRGLNYALVVSMSSDRGRARMCATLVRTADAAVLEAFEHELEGSRIFDPGIIASQAKYRIEQDWLENAKAESEENWGPYTHFLRGEEIYHAQWNSPEICERTSPHFERASELGSDLPQALPRLNAVLSQATTWPGEQGRDDLVDAFWNTCAGALAFDPTLPDVNRMLAAALLYYRDYKATHYHLSRGLRHNPNDAHLHVHFGRFLTHIGEPQRALAAVRRAQKLNPHHPDAYWEQLALALYGLERYEDALAALQKIRSASYYEYFYMAACQRELDQQSAAEHSIERAIRDRPNLRLPTIARLLPYRDESVSRRILRHLKAAGMP